MPGKRERCQSRRRRGGETRQGTRSNFLARCWRGKGARTPGIHIDSSSFNFQRYVRALKNVREAPLPPDRARFERVQQRKHTESEFAGRDGRRCCFPAVVAAVRYMDN